MRYGGASRHAVRQVSSKVAELDLPVPFDLGAWAGLLERRDPRAILLVPVTIEPGNPSGLWARTAAADYIYYEQQTSPFHQAHIAAYLVAYAAALTWGRDQETKIREGRWTDRKTGKITVSEWIDRWLALQDVGVSTEQHGGVQARARAADLSFGRVRQQQPKDPTPLLG